jgi:hypothetical protein
VCGALCVRQAKSWGLYRPGQCILRGTKWDESRLRGIGLFQGWEVWENRLCQNEGRRVGNPGRMLWSKMRGAGLGSGLIQF